MKNFSRFLLVVLVFASGNPLLAQWVQTAGPGGGEINDLAVSPNGAGGTNLFAGTGGGEYGTGGSVFLSSDNGASWTEVNSGLAYTFVESFGVSPDGAGGTNLFAGTD